MGTFSAQKQKSLSGFCPLVQNIISCVNQMYDRYMTIAFGCQGFPGLEPFQFNAIPVLVYPQHPAVYNLAPNGLELRPQSNINSASITVDPTDPALRQSGQSVLNIGADKKLRSKRSQKKSKTSKSDPDENEEPESKKSRVWKNSLLSFTCNKILKFILDTNKSLPILKAVLEHHDLANQEAIDQFYSYATKAIDKIINRISIHKIRELWLGPVLDPSASRSGPEHDKTRLYHHIFRVLSNYYLEKVGVSFILLAKKSKKPHWFQHFRMRRWLIKNLRDPESFTCYKDFSPSAA